MRNKLVVKENSIQMNLSGEANVRNILKEADPAEGQDEGLIFWRQSKPQLN